MPNLPKGKGGAKNIPRMSPKNQKDNYSRPGDMPILSLFQCGGEPTKGLRDLQEICNYCEKVQKHSRNVPTNFQKNISSWT